MVLGVAVMLSRAPVEAGSLTGVVLDGQDRPVSGACVILCDQESGIPICSQSYKLLTEEMMAGNKTAGNKTAGNKTPEPAYAFTNDQGSFSLGEVPEGEYRLVAQSWQDASSVWKPYELSGKAIELRGIAQHVKVSSGLSPSVALRPLGVCVLRIDENIRKAGILVVISTAPPRADPIPGFAGWGGEFMQNMIGWSRKPAGVTTIRGLPEGMVHVGMWATPADDMSGFGAGKADVKATAVTDLHICVGSSWADGGHQPPPEHLLWLIDELKDKPYLDILRANGIVFNTGQATPGSLQWLFLYYGEISRHFGKEITLPGEQNVPFRDFMEAAWYIEQEQWRKRLAEKKTE